MKKMLLLILAFILFAEMNPVFAESSRDYAIHSISDPKNNLIRYDNRFTYIVDSDKRLTLINQYGKYIVSPNDGYSLINGSYFARTVLFQGDRLWLIKDGKHGCIDANGNVIVDFIYEKLGTFNNGIANAIVNGRETVLDINGNELTEYGMGYGCMSEFINGYSFVRNESIGLSLAFSATTSHSVFYTSSPWNVYTKLDELEQQFSYGYSMVNRQGEVIFSGLEANLQSSYILSRVQPDPYPYAEIRIIPSYFTGKGIAVVKKDGMFGIIDTNGDIVQDFTLSSFRMYNSFVLGEIEKQWILFNEYGEPIGELDDPRNLTIINQENKSALFVIKKDDKWGIVDEDYSIILPFEFEAVSAIRETKTSTYHNSADVEYLQINKDGKYGIYSVGSKECTEIEYDAISAYNCNDKLVFIAKQNDKYGVIDTNNAVLIPFVYDELKANPYYNSYQNPELVGIFQARQNDSWGLVDINNNILVPVEFESIYRDIYTDKFCLVMSDDKFGVYDIHKKTISHLTYDPSLYEIMKLNKDYLSIISSRKSINDSNKYGAIDWYGNEVLECEHGYVFNSGFFPVAFNATTGFNYAYYDDNFNLLLYSKDGKTYDNNDNIICDIAIRRFDARLSNGMLVSQHDFGYGLLAAYEIPKPQVNNNGNYICLALNNPIINIDGKHRLIEENNWFFRPLVENNLTLLPLRVIFEALNAEVLWDNELQTVSAVKDDTTIKISVDKNEMYINGNMIWLDTPARLVNGRTLVPFRAVAEAFDANVEWNEDKQLITIIY